MVTRSLLVLGHDHGIAAAIGARLCASNRYVAAVDDETAAAILIEAVDEGQATPFLELSEADFARQVIDATLERHAAFASALACVADGGAILVMTSDAYLGRWHGAGQAAGSAGLIGMMRSIAMEHVRRGIRVNALAVPFGIGPDDLRFLREAALLAAALLESGAASGQCVLADGGDNLKLRQARRR